MTLFFGKERSGSFDGLGESIARGVREEVDDDADEVMYDSCCESQGGETEMENEPYDDTKWLEGAPQKAIAQSMGVIQQCWSQNVMLAELLTESEVKRELMEHAEILATVTPLSIISALKGKTYDELLSGVLDSTSATTGYIKGLACLCVGTECKTSTEWKDTCCSLAEQGAVALLLQVYSILASVLLQDAQLDEANPTPSPLGSTLRAVVNGIAAILIGTGAGHPIKENKQCPMTNLITSQIYKHDKNRSTDILTETFVLIRDAPGMAHNLPGKKLVILAHLLISAMCGGVDLKPAVWKDETHTTSNRWVGDGVVEQYIRSIVQSGQTNKRFAFISPDLLRACHYYFYQEALKMLNDSVTPNTTSLAGNAPVKFKGLPLPVRESLAVFGVNLAESAVKRRDATVMRPVKLFKDEHPMRMPPLDDTSEAPSLSNLSIPDPREVPSLSAEYPPSFDKHLQPEDMLSIGTPDPVSWYSLKGTAHAKAEELDVDHPAELLFRSLCPVLPGVVVGVFKLFLASLPGEGEAAKSATGHECGSYGITSTHEATRHRNIMIKCVTGLLLHVIKVLTEYSPIKAEVVLKTMADSNGLLLLLKYLHQNSVFLLTGVEGVGETGWDEAIEQPCPLPVHDGIHVPWTAEPGLEASLPTCIRTLVNLDADIQGVIQCDARNLLTCTNVLHLIRKLIKKHPSRLALMLFYKMHILLRRKLRIIHPLMTLYGVKLLAELNPHMGRKWRTQNTKALSQLYRYLEPTIPDTCAATNASIDAHDTSTELPVPQEQCDAEVYQQKVVEEYTNMDYPAFRPAV